jgi:hypothetical protein
MVLFGSVVRACRVGECVGRLLRRGESQVMSSDALSTTGLPARLQLVHADAATGECPNSCSGRNSHAVQSAIPMQRAVPGRKACTITLGQLGRAAAMGLGTVPVHQAWSFSAQIKIPSGASPGSSYLLGKGTLFDECPTMAGEVSGSCAGYYYVVAVEVPIGEGTEQPICVRNPTPPLVVQRARSTDPQRWDSAERSYRTRPGCPPTA